MKRKITLFFNLVVCMVALAVTVNAQSNYGSISGTVKTSDGNPAAYVSVGIKNSNKTTQSDDNGKFYIKNVPAGNYTLKISAVGLSTQEKEISVKNGENFEVSFSIAESLSQLDEVAISGYRHLIPNLLT